MKVTDKIILTNEDNIELMKRYPDKYFDLAIVDPPYSVADFTGKEFSHGRGKLKNRLFNKGHKKINEWDKTPPPEYFKELFRVSKNQIIWGGNYFHLPPTRGIICWDKCQPWENFSQIEYAWTSFDNPAKLFRIDNRTGDKIHPTQKPIQLYKELIAKYAKQGDKILDTHLGSMSIAIACHDLGFELIGCELDKDYYNTGIERVKKHISQLTLFRPEELFFH